MKTELPHSDLRPVADVPGVVTNCAGAGCGPFASVQLNNSVRTYKPVG
jgi:hypothetical protein